MIFFPQPRWTDFGGKITAANPNNISILQDEVKLLARPAVASFVKTYQDLYIDPREPLVVEMEDSDMILRYAVNPVSPDELRAEWVVLAITHNPAGVVEVIVDAETSGIIGIKDGIKYHTGAVSRARSNVRFGKIMSAFWHVTGSGMSG